jgi:hypothetical protein
MQILLTSRWRNMEKGGGDILPCKGVKEGGKYINICVCVWGGGESLKGV